MNQILLYIDPGTGSFILQALVAGILSVGVFFRTHVVTFWRKITGKPPLELDDDEDDDEDDELEKE